MDPPFLVTDEINSGWRVVSRLDQAQIPVSGAWWSYDNEASQWSLAVATPLMDVEGPRSVYERVQRALAHSPATSDFPLWRVALLSPQAPQVQVARQLVGQLENPNGLALVANFPGQAPSNVVVFRLR